MNYGLMNNYKIVYIFNNTFFDPNRSHMDDESEGQKVEPHPSTASRNLLDVQTSSDRHPLHDTPTQSQSDSFIISKGTILAILDH